MLGNAFIGISIGYILKKYKVNNFVALFIVAISIFIGIGLIKTVVECFLYDIPFAIKFAKDMIATVADLIPMYFGIILGNILKKKEFIKNLLL